MNTPVLLTHVGAVTSMGLSAFETAFVYRAQGTGLRLSALADPETGEALLVGGVPTLEPSLVVRSEPSSSASSRSTICGQTARPHWRVDACTCGCVWTSGSPSVISKASCRRSK